MRNVRVSENQTSYLASLSSSSKNILCYVGSLQQAMMSVCDNHLKQGVAMCVPHVMTVSVVEAAREQIVDVPVPPVMKEIVEDVRRQIVDVPVLQMKESVDAARSSSPERVPRRTVVRIVNVRVPHFPKESAEAGRSSLQEHHQKRTVEKILDLPDIEVRKTSES